MPEIPAFDHDAVLSAIDPLEAIDRVRRGFVEYASGEWEMPSKVYLDAAPTATSAPCPRWARAWRS